jgi:hypothetical protein
MWRPNFWPFVDQTERDFILWVIAIVVVLLALGWHPLSILDVPPMLRS